MPRMHRQALKAAGLLLLLAPFATPASAQQVMDGSDKRILPENLASIFYAIAEQSPDPYGSQFRRLVYRNDGASICGEVNLRNSSGGFEGFKRFAIDRKTFTVTFEDDRPASLDCP